MLDKIHGNMSESIAQSQNLEKLNGLGVSNPYEKNDKLFFIDQFDISQTAMDKYQREMDIKNFTDFFYSVSEQEANERVLSGAFDGQLPLGDDIIISEMLNDNNFLRDVFE